MGWALTSRCRAGCLHERISVCRNCIFLLVIAAVGQIKIVFFSAMISPGMHYDAGLCRPAGGGSCSPAFCAAGSTTVVFYRQHVLKSMLKLSHSRMLSCGVLRVHDSQPRSSRMRKCLNVDLLSTQAYSCKCSSPRLFSAADMSLKCANMGTARIDFRQLGDCGLYIRHALNHSYVWL